MTLTIEEALQAAVTYHQTGQLEDAERLYRGILQAQSNHPDANHNLGLLAVQVKRPAAGLPHFKAALEANPRQAQYWLSYIDALIQVGQTTLAQQVLEQGRQRGLKGDAVEILAERLGQPISSPTEQPIKLDAAIAHREAGRYEEAAAVLKELLTSNPQDANCLALLAHVLSLDGQDEPAWALLSSALTANPNLPVVQRNHARLLLKRQRPTEALHAARSAYHEDMMDPENQLVLAMVLGANNQDDVALPLIESALQCRPNYAEAFANRALLKLRRKEFSAALSDAEQSLSIKPHIWQLWSIVGSLRYQLGNVLGAIDALEKAIEFEPENVDHMVTLGDFKRQAGKVDDAITLLEKAVAIAPDNAGAWTNLGTALQERKRIKEARHAYSKALLLEPQLAQIAHNVAVLALEEGNFGDAQHHFSQALEAKPDFVEAVYGMGTLLKKMGDLESSAIYLERCLMLQPDDPLGARHLLASLGLGQVPEQVSQAQLDRLYLKRSQTWDEGKNYYGHKLVADILVALTHRSKKLDILDAGCGTGRVGLLVRHLANTLDGIDISHPMLARAREKHIYDRLHQGDLVSFMRNNQNAFDAITCAATLIHFGDLAPAFDAAAFALREDGLFILTLFPNNNNESNAPDVIVAKDGLGAGGCYAHRKEYVARLAQAAGFAVEKLDIEIHEYDNRANPVMGLVVALRRQCNGQ